MATYLDRILVAHRSRASEDRRALGALAEQAASAPPPRDFLEALRARAGTAVIAEIKRRSPSKGALAESLVAGDVARAYEAGGAACLSVLTDGPFFGGSSDDLVEARAACSLPVLRKDFTVSEADVYDARAMGADAVLLIVAALDDAELRAFRALAAELRMAVLVETHDEREVERALEAGADLVGVNQRDLTTFAVDRARAERVVASIPPGVVRVAESGIDGRDAARAIWSAGYDAVLVGEHLVRSGDPAVAVRALREAAVTRCS